jgi:hypothetical protein
MEYFIIGLNIALFFGALAGLVGLFALPFLANMIVKNRNETASLRSVVGNLERQLREKIDYHAGRISDLHGKMLEHHAKISLSSKQLDGIESDLEKAKLSSIAPVKGAKSPVRLTKRPILDKIKGSSVDSVVKNNVHHLSKSKQGGKRANKSRNR